MHPPQFLHSHLPSDWPECYLEAHCRRCMGRSSVSAVKGLQRWHGNVSFEHLLCLLKCEFCKGKPTSVHLCASQHRTACSGPPPGWAIELIASP